MKKPVLTRYYASFGEYTMNKTCVGLKDHYILVGELDAWIHNFKALWHIKCTDVDETSEII